SNSDNHIDLFSDITRIFHDMNKNNLQIAIVSNNGNKALCDRALYLFNAPDINAAMQPINPRFIKYNENSSELKSDMFKHIKEWSGFDYSEMVFFDLDSNESRKVNADHECPLGVQLKVVDKQTGITWKEYQDALQSTNGSHGHNHKQSVGKLAPDTGMPSLGARLGAGKFAEAYRAKHDPESVIKKLRYWRSCFQTRFVEIYKVIESGRPFEPKNKPNQEDEQFLFMIAIEFRNLKLVGELRAPELDRFCGWFQSKYIHGTPIWETPGYKHFTFTVPFQVYVRCAFHLVVDRLEWAVKEYGVEHRDAHLGNVKFVVNEKARLLDW
ncbi:uncharacterized protein EDB93DRAFT_1089858, partial [Suillus bovinus]|uniref:uncharacterized protein n=1 Tax=Suillus bovinus TaxID=48563 RepID=UPI001B86EAFC